MKRNMSLVNRVSIFFLASLALVLVFYSVMLYGILRHYLQQQFDGQLRGAFQTLVAAVEIESDDVKFEPSDHTIALGTETGLEDIRWVICDERGLLVDRSKNLTPSNLKDQQLLAYATQLRNVDDDSIDMGHWRVLQMRLAAVSPKAAELRDPLEREALVVTVGRSPDDLNANLRMIGALLVALPIGIGGAAAIAGRRICRKALQPLGEMVRRARAMANSDAERRLPLNDSRDELTELGESFNAVLDRLFSALERQRRFAGDAAHQLRTPLTAVIGQLDVALRRPRSAEEYRETLSIVREQAGELGQIVEGLLFLARAQKDTTIPDAQSLSLSDWLSAYHSQWSAHPRFHDLRLVHAPSNVHGDATILASPVLLKQLLDNLVSNAMKYSEAPSPVSIVATQRNNEVDIAVQDCGRGISAEDQKLVFQPFFRSADARRSGVAGTGLGLPVAARIAVAMGGRLTCQSQLGQGSEFTLTLPLAEPDTMGERRILAHEGLSRLEAPRH